MALLNITIPLLAALVVRIPLASAPISRARSGWMILCKILLVHFRVAGDLSLSIVVRETTLMTGSKLIPRIASGLTRNSRTSWRWLSRVLPLSRLHLRQRIHQLQRLHRLLALVQLWPR